MVKKALIALALATTATAIIGCTAGDVEIEPEQEETTAFVREDKDYLVRDCWYCANNTVIWPDGNIWAFDEPSKKGFAYFGDSHITVTAVMNDNGTPGDVYDDILLGVFAER